MLVGLFVLNIISFAYCLKYALTHFLSWFMDGVLHYFFFLLTAWSLGVGVFDVTVHIVIVFLYFGFNCVYILF